MEGRWLFCPEFPDSDFRIAWTDEGKAAQPTTFLTWEKTVSFSINGAPVSILRITQITRFWLYPPKGVRHTRKCNVFTRLSGLCVIQALPTSRNASPATLSTLHLLCRAAVQIGGPSYLCPSGIFCLSTPGSSTSIHSCNDLVPSPGLGSLILSTLNGVSSYLHMACDLTFFHLAYKCHPFSSNQFILEHTPFSLVTCNPLCLPWS